MTMLLAYRIIKEMISNSYTLLFDKEKTGIYDKVIVKIWLLSRNYCYYCVHVVCLDDFTSLLDLFLNFQICMKLLLF